MLGNLGRTVGTVVVLLLLGACASQPNEIATASVSTIQYEGYTCEQIALDVSRVQRRADELHASLKKKADNDGAQMAVGLILFWPALLFLEGGDGPEAQEYARLKGEAYALETVSIQKACHTKPAVLKAPKT
ncbi:MAG: metal ABC transporter ATP-binding protein [Alphaproteobacteria bacterium]